MHIVVLAYAAECNGSPAGKVSTPAFCPIYQFQRFTSPMQGTICGVRLNSM